MGIHWIPDGDSMAHRMWPSAEFVFGYGSDRPADNAETKLPFAECGRKNGPDDSPESLASSALRVRRAMPKKASSGTPAAIVRVPHMHQERGSSGTQVRASFSCDVIAFRRAAQPHPGAGGSTRAVARITSSRSEYRRESESVTASMPASMILFSVNKALRAVWREHPVKVIGT